MFIVFIHEHILHKISINRNRKMYMYLPVALNQQEGIRGDKKGTLVICVLLLAIVHRGL